MSSLSSWFGAGVCRLSEMGEDTLFIFNRLAIVLYPNKQKHNELCSELSGGVITFQNIKASY